MKLIKTSTRSTAANSARSSAMSEGMPLPLVNNQDERNPVAGSGGKDVPGG
jgi:hypothetical protein